MNDDDISSAVEAGILDARSAEALRAHLRRRHAATAAPLGDDERFRLLTGFNDVFIVVAMLVLLTAMVYLTGRQSDLLGGLSLFAGAWTLAEYFVARRRLPCRPWC